MIQKIKRIRCAVVTWGTHSLALPIIRLVLTLEKFPYTIYDIRKMADTSVGALPLQFLEGHQLQLLRDYETHDIKHALLGYPANEVGEASLQYFFLGNGQRSLPVLLTVIITFFIMPEYHQSFKKAYIRGKQTPELAYVNWITLLPLEVKQVIRSLKIPPHFEDVPWQMHDKTKCSHGLCYPKRSFASLKSARPETSGGARWGCL